MLINVASQLGVPYVGTGAAPTPPPVQPSIDTTDLEIWWDPGNPAGYDVGASTLKNLSPKGTDWDAPQSLLNGGAGASATLDVAGRYIEYVKTANGAVNHYAANNGNPSYFTPASTAFTWIAWYAPISLSGNFINIFPFQTLSGGISYIRARAESTIWQTNSTTAGQDTWTFSLPTSGTWYMLAIAADNAGGLSANLVSRSAYYNGVLDKTDPGSIISVSPGTEVGWAHGDRSVTTRVTTTRSGASIFYKRKLSGAEILDIYNTYRPYYPESF